MFQSTLLATSLIAASLLGSCATGRQYVPAANPESPFSNAVLIDGTLHVAGHLGLDKATGRAPADPATEAGLLLDAFTTTLEKGGMDLSDLVMVQVFCSDISLYDTFNKIYRQRFTGSFPARAFVGSGTLLRGCRFEMLGQARR